MKILNKKSQTLETLHTWLQLMNLLFKVNKKLYNKWCFYIILMCKTDSIQYSMTSHKFQYRKKIVDQVSDTLWRSNFFTILIVLIPICHINKKHPCIFHDIISIIHIINTINWLNASFKQFWKILLSKCNLFIEVKLL